MDGRQPNRDDPDTPTRNSTNPNVFDDEYAVDRDGDLDFGFGVADGFRPGRDSGGNGAVASNRNSIPLTHRSSVRHSISENFPADTKTPPAPPAPRTSMSKGHFTSSSLSMANDGSASQFAPDRNNTFTGTGFGRPLAHRASVASTSSFATEQRSQSPFAGNSGPSHPYGMYPQGTGLARSLSVATTSTVQAPRQSLSGQGPTHPYGMYPQNVIEDTEDDAHAAPVQNSIPVGFPGLGQGFHRQIGPDGEEQDIIGPDGHTEQLPPYSRFPEEGPTKASLMAVPEEMGPVTPAGTAITAGTAVAAGAAAGAVAGAAAASNSRDTLLVPTSAATQNNDLSNEQSRQTQDQQQSGGSEASSTLVGSEQSAEKAWKEKNWKEKRGTKIWGGKVPVWVLIVAIVIIVILAVVLGAVLGSFMAAKHMRDAGHQQDKQQPSKVTVTYSMFDASTIATPSSLAPLPTGKYALAIRSPDVSSNECLTESSQNDAWSCEMQGPPIEINIGGSNNNYKASVSPLENSTSIQYGCQIPNITDQSLTLVEDLDSPSDGPAWHFQLTYDKVVILAPQDFSGSRKMLKRHSQGDFSLPPFMHRQVEAGDTPWYCVFNQTFIEGFLYVDVNSSASSASASTTTSSSSSTTPTSSTQSAVARAASTSQPTSTTASAGATATGSSNKRRGDSSSSDDSSTDSDDLHWYSRLVKIEERRVSDSPQPYCQKMQLLDDGDLVAYKDSSGKTVIVELTETDPSYEDYKNSDESTSSVSSSSKSSSKRMMRMFRRSEPANSCHCQWTFS